MNYAVIENENVVNIVVSSAEFASTQGWVECPDWVRIGDFYINGQFVKNPALDDNSISE